MITVEDFLQWVRQHCVATAAQPEVAVALIENREIIIREWRPTRLELSDCTARLVAKRRVPKFANEHSDAIGNELHHLRLEQNELDRWCPPAVPGPAPGPACDTCRDSGFVPVPLPLCIEVPHNAPPRLVPYPGYRVVLSGSVVCDRAGCRAGIDVRSKDSGKYPRPTLSKYLSRFHGVNVAAMLEQHEREIVAQARRGAGKDTSGLTEALERLKARIAA